MSEMFDPAESVRMEKDRFEPLASNKISNEPLFASLFYAHYV